MTTYAELLADRAGIDVTDAALARAGVLPPLEAGGDLSIREWRDVFAPVTEFIQQQAGHDVDREIASDYRVAALMQEGLFEPAAAGAQLTITASPEESGRFLDSEIIAVYW